MTSDLCVLCFGSHGESVINSRLIVSTVPVFVIDCVMESLDKKKKKAALDLVLVHCSTF